MRRTGILMTLIGLAVVGLCVLPNLKASRVRASGGRTVPQGVVVKLNQASDLFGVAIDYGLDPAPISQFGQRPIYLLRINDLDSPNDVADRLIAAPQGRVAYA